MKTPPRAAAALSIGLLICVLYGRTLGYGLVWDDYAALRPLGAAALVGAWAGPWDPGGVWPDFYRPLSIAVYQAMYALFGHNGAALHAVNLAELFLAAWMLRAFVRRETTSDALGLTAAVLLVAHPETPSSLAAWISQQFHLVALIAALGAMLTWQRIRHGGARMWLWVLAPLTVGVLVKEDVLMVAPALLAWQFVRMHIVGDVPGPSRRVVMLVGAWGVLYGAWRTAALGAMGGYATPAPGRMLLNILDGPLFTFGLQWIPSAHGLSLVSGVGVAVLAALAWRGRRHATPAHIALALYGASLGVLANLPLTLMSAHTRLHLMVLAAALAFTAAAGVAGAALTADGRRLPRVVMAFGFVWAMVVGATNWINTNTFAPCAPETLQRNTEVLAWDIVAPDVRARIAADMAACRPVGRGAE